MEAFESKMRRATDLKNAKQRQMQQSAQQLHSQGDAKLMMRQEQEQSTWMNDFEKNVLRRAEIEKRKKKKQKELLANNIYNIGEKLTKKAENKRRLED